MEICFQGIGQAAATFQTEEDTLTAGMAVTMSGNSAVGLGTTSSLPCGVALGPARNGVVCVQIGGVAEVKYSGTAPKAGYALLTCDGAGGVTVATNTGYNCLVLSVNEEKKTVVIKL